MKLQNPPASASNNAHGASFVSTIYMGNDKSKAMVFLDGDRSTTSPQIEGIALIEDGKYTELPKESQEWDDFLAENDNLLQSILA